MKFYEKETPTQLLSSEYCQIILEWFLLFLLFCFSKKKKKNVARMTNPQSKHYLTSGKVSYWIKFLLKCVLRTTKSKYSDRN